MIRRPEGLQKAREYLWGVLVCKGYLFSVYTKTLFIRQSSLISANKRHRNRENLQKISENSRRLAD
jgi:hypothetical protein